MNRSKMIFAIAKKLALSLAILGLLNSCKKGVEEGSHDESGYDIEDYGDFKLHVLNIDGKKAHIKEENNTYYWSDCEILTTRQFNLLKKLHNNLSTSERATVYKDLSRLWPEGKVYYTLNNIATQRKRDTIIAALNDMEAKTGVRFFARTNQPNYIRFQDATVNNSLLGMAGGEQIVNINDIRVPLVQHEVMHALGIHHEQCRPDRDNYVVYHESRVNPEYRHNFNVNNNFVGLRAFDYKSVMLYRQNSFSNNGQPTLTGIGGVTWGDNVYGPGAKLSAGDIEGIKYLYQTVNMAPILRMGHPVILVSGVNNSSALDLQSSNTTDNNNIVLWGLNNTNAQNWYIVSAGGGEYYIASSIDQNKVIGTQAGGTANGTKVVIKTKNTSARDQRWKFYLADNGNISVSMADDYNKVIDISGGSGTNGTHAVIWSRSTSGSPNQRFRFLYHE